MIDWAVQLASRMRKRLRRHRKHIRWPDACQCRIPALVFDVRRAERERCVTDVRRAERERCVAEIHRVFTDDELDRGSFELGVAACKAAIEALGDD